MSKIKVNTIGIAALRQNTIIIKSKADDCVQAISYVRRNIDMNTASAENIQARLQSLQKRMQAQEDKLAKYASFLTKVNDDFTAADRKIANQSKKVRYLLDQIISQSPFFRTRETLDLSVGVAAHAALAGLFGLSAVGGCLIPFQNGLPGSFKTPPSTAYNHEPFISSFIANMPGAEPSLWDRTKGFAEKIWDEVKDTTSSDWKNLKHLLHTKPVKYLYETGKDTLSVTCEVLSFVRNVATGKGVSAAVNVYKTADKVIDIGQDLTATVFHTAGALFDVFGAGKAADILYAEAASYAERDGIAGELGAAGAEGLAKLVRWIDIGADTVKLSSSVQSIDEARIAYYSMEEGSSFKFIKAMVSTSGIKLERSAAAFYSNLKAGIELTEGVLEDGFWDAIAKNAPIGKPLIKAVKIVGKAVDNLE